MKATWPLVPLGEVLRHRKEFIEIDDTQTYKRCRVQLHAQGVVLRDQVPGLEIKTKKQQVCQAGEFLVAEIDAKLGGYGIVPKELHGAIVSSHYFLFGINTDKLHPGFLEFFQRTPAFAEQVAAQGSTNYAAIRPSHVLAYKIPLPPMEEQRRIVARIGDLANRLAIASRLRAESNVEREFLQRGIGRQLFKSKMWPIVPLERVCDVISDCLHSNPICSEDGTFPTVRSPDIGWGTIELKNAYKTDEAEYIRRTRRSELQIGDLVLVREGGGTGKAGLVENGDKFSLGQRVMMLRPNTTIVEPRFLLHQWLSPLIYQEQIVDQMTGSASPHLNIKVLRQFNFVLPSIPEQRHIVAYLDGLAAKTATISEWQEATAVELQALLPSVLDRAFKGEL
jgi:type I restriction enzyme, S subunit